ncbi:ubiquitin interaction domain-containing protein [Colletotrichum gloeosporioides Cg-14]|uniref:Ubiquitin interaction domain-containing protein n=1 Tax=Colletotrichum gloeosporioides (strain Cg-14) TaxID=1237896 RepID=T0JPB9_COLGC|nr:ubiquitin interaction domain-containing protein [Colletotrichum gloeosporioides Cg-14]
MAGQPSEADIATFCEWTALVTEGTGIILDHDRAMATVALKSGRSVDQLVEEYYNGPEAFRKKYTWDDTAFGADRDGAANNTGIGTVAFNIEAPDSAVIQGVAPAPDNFYGQSAGAPSRPPSRTNNRSPLGAPTSAAQEDEDLQAAIRNSAIESGLTPQEAGVTTTGANAAYFGPANRADYDSNSWAMVPTGVDSSESKSNDDSAPSLRKREQGAPAFLVQQPHSRTEQHRLGSILTILHEIPLVRNALLSAGEPAASYGHNSEWWKGQPIYKPHVLAAMERDELQWGDDAKPDFHEEIHRLMAFLDQTERSYGSVEAMAYLVPASSYPLERQFFDSLHDHTDPEVIKPLTHSAHTIYTMTLENYQEPSRFSYLSFELQKDQYEKTKTLYEALDWVVWNDACTWTEITPETKMVYLDDIGEVMIMAIDGTEPPESMDIPEVWYPERYLAGRKEEARVIQEHIAWVFNRLYKAGSMEYEATNWVDNDTYKVYDVKEMLEKTIKEYEGQVQYLDGLGRFRELQKLADDEKQSVRPEDVPCVKTAEEEELSKTAEQMVKRCRQLLSEQEAKLAKLKWERERLTERQRSLGKLLTDPNHPGLSKPFIGKKYLLRGVSTGKDVTYVCKREEPSLIELDENSGPVDQWWRLSYTTGDAQPAKAERVSYELVMRQMFQETRRPMFVYATEDAINQTPVPLSDALQRFVRAENKNFRQELSRETTDGATEARDANANTSRVSPAKRQYRSGSVDSMDTNRASLGGSDTNSRDGDFELDHDVFSAGDGAVDIAMPDLSHSQIIDNSKSLAEVMYSGGAPAAGTSDVLSVPQLTESSNEASASGDVDVSRTVTPDFEDQPKGPEMQERSSNGGGSPFMARRSIHFGSPPPYDPRDEQKTIKIMDMEMPDEHQ